MSIEIKQAGDVTVFELSGKFDTAHQGGDLVKKAEEAVTRGNMRLLFDVAAATDIDDVTISRLKTLRDQPRIHSRAPDMRICGRSDNIARSQSCMKFYMTFVAFKDQPTAVRSFP